MEKKQEKPVKQRVTTFPASVVGTPAPKKQDDKPEQNKPKTDSA